MCIYIFFVGFSFFVVLSSIFLFRHSVATKMDICRWIDSVKTNCFKSHYNEIRLENYSMGLFSNAVGNQQCFPFRTPDDFPVGCEQNFLCAKILSDFFLPLFPNNFFYAVILFYFCSSCFAVMLHR